MTTQHTPKVSVSVQIDLVPVSTTNRLAEGKIVFKGGPLDGCSFVGFTIWQNRNGNGENVTFPAGPTPTTKAKSARSPTSRVTRRASHSCGRSFSRRTAPRATRPRRNNRLTAGRA